MKQAEFLNLDTKQVQVLDASLYHPNLVRVPEGAEIAIEFNDDPEGHGIIFYKDDGKTSAAKDNGFLWKSGSLWSMKELLDPDFKDDDIDLSHVILWQRQSPLRQKVDEAKQKTGLNERQLSHKIGREESYITKMFSDKRNPKPATIDKLIEDLDIVMNYDEFKRVIKKATADNEINAMKICYEQEIKLKIALLNQANQNAEMYRHKCEAQANLIKWMGGLIALLLILGIAMVAL